MNGFGKDPQGHEVVAEESGPCRKGSRLRHSEPSIT
jgi:hypothetical protein